MVKIGILGGTFDPVHLGHLCIAEEAKAVLGLEKVIMVPAGQPPFKADNPVTAAEHRLQMLKLAVGKRVNIEILTSEMERPGPSYSVDTIAELRQQYGSEADLYFILGWDGLAQLAEWHEPERIIEMCKLAGVARPGSTRPDLTKMEEKLPGITRRVVWLDKTQIDISASEIRQMAARGEAIDHVVPGAVAEYIKENKLYRI